jgi:predicted RNA-binding Zn ribbon-like protein
MVDGLVLPAPVGGHVALDFCNTRAGWGEPTPGEYLRSFDHLAVWTAAAGLIDPEEAGRLRRRAHQDRRAAQEALERAREFRTALHEVLLEPAPGSSWRTVAFEAESAAEAATLRLGPNHAEWALSPRLGLAIPVLAVAREAAALLTSDDARAVRACPGRDCGWLFLDRSGRRRWCTMAVCGNRAKVRRFAERRSAPDARTRPHDGATARAGSKRSTSSISSTTGRTATSPAARPRRRSA